MSSPTDIIEANDEIPCYACGRKHRKLFLQKGGFWLGRSCAQDYQMFLEFPNPNDIRWVGYEKSWEKINNMMKAKG